MKNKFSEEHNSMGLVPLTADKHRGAHTQRSIKHFKIGGTLMPVEINIAFAVIKKAAAIVNHRL